ncbi:hypothetical protein [Paenibacillus sp.]|uniref:hypothetical protein n=1 Tax=Paenibacillus sp. TaxID=58172 RepID=UPI002811E3D7|nr:hypothetical protein [Paenibacillus sp.]
MEVRKNRNWKTMLAAAALLGVTATSVNGASAAEDTSPGRSSLSVDAVQAVVPADGAPVVRSFVGAAGNLLAEPAHERLYWKLLAATYAPELADEWATALAERKEIEAKLPKGKPYVVMLREGEAKAEIAEPFTLEFSENGRTLRMSGKPGALALPPLPEGEGDVVLNREPTEETQRRIELAAAVEAEDGAAIAALLPQLLEDFRKRTESLRTMVETLDEASQAQE